MQPKRKPRKRLPQHRKPRLLTFPPNPPRISLLAYPAGEIGCHEMRTLRAFAVLHQRHPFDASRGCDKRAVAVLLAAKLLQRTYASVPAIGRNGKPLKHKRERRSFVRVSDLGLSLARTPRNFPVYRTGIL